MSISSTNQFYVYVYLDPRKPGKFKYGKYEFEYEPFYVGKGYSHRILEHFQDFFLEHDKNKLKVNKIKKIIKETNKQPISLKFQENLLEQEAFELETKMIKTIGRIDLRTGPLTNLTNGGEGSSGRIINQETRIKISKSNLGRKCSEEFKRKRREYMLNIFKPKPMSEKQKQQISNRMIGKYEGNKNPMAIYCYEIIDPSGKKFFTECLKTFCKSNKLIYTSVQYAISVNKPYKNWIFIRNLKP